jgi:alpha-galactosidase
LSDFRPEITGVCLKHAVDASGFPMEAEWEHAAPVCFSHDWQGRNEDPQRQTEVRVLWSDSEIYVRFRCRYRAIYTYQDGGENGRKDELWERDVAEVFLQTDRFGEKYYKEFEVSPNGQWLDLDITPQGLIHIASGMRSQVKLDERSFQWTANLAIPMGALTPRFDPDYAWRVNFFRCEGTGPQRYYSAWQPTGTPEPDFHVPEKFGSLKFRG